MKNYLHDYEEFFNEDTKYGGLEVDNWAEEKAYARLSEYDKHKTEKDNVNYESDARYYNYNLNSLSSDNFLAASNNALDKRVNEPPGCIEKGKLTEIGEEYYAQEIVRTKKLLDEINK